MKNIFITRPVPGSCMHMLHDKGYNVTIGKFKIPPTKKELIKELNKKEYEVVITLLTDKIDKEVMDASPKTKLFANYAIGYDNFDLAEGTRRGVVFTNTPGDYVDGIAQHTVALILALMARLSEADHFVRRGKYKGWDPMLFIGDKLKDKTVAIIGTGRIGTVVARKLQRGFDAKIVYYDVNRNESIEKECNAQFIPSVEEALKIADVVSLHVPLLPSTHHLINKERLALMKRTAYLVNTSRGPVIDENALVEALKDHEIRGAGLDVYEFEPRLARGLDKCPNTIFTPHTASGQLESREEMSRILAENVIDFLEGREPRNKVKSV